MTKNFATWNNLALHQEWEHWKIFLNIKKKPCWRKRENFINRNTKHILIWLYFVYFISGDLVSQAPTTKTPPPTFSRKQSSKSKKSESNRNKSGSGNRVVPDFDTVYSRGGITIRTQRLVADGSAISTVTIRDPTPPHSGLYNCRPANLDPAHVNLHVIQGTYIIFQRHILKVS